MTAATAAATSDRIGCIHEERLDVPQALLPPSP